MITDNDVMIMQQRCQMLVDKLDSYTVGELMVLYEALNISLDKKM